MNKVVNLIGPLCKELRDVDMDLPTVLIDGALKWKSSFKNSFSVGDGDSYYEETGLKGSFDYPYPSDKNETDLTLSLKHLAEKFDFDEIHAYGLMGGRRDHELANFFEICQFLEGREQKVIRFFYDEKKLICFYAKGSYEFSYHGMFSLFTLRQQDINLSGDVLYKITRENSHNLPQSGLGISNKASGNIKLMITSATIWYGPV